ncbi:L-rhamnose mutarotase [Chitinophaga sp. MM2321]|uniref:L-rhamnose mutarotase n=1 Tax=Chitinophaga sp. MM2321 TaxID=3137178 RepID=UPI0032D59A40
MKKIIFFLLAGATLAATALITGCTQKQVEVKKVQEFEDRVFVVNIVHDSLKLKAYLNYHKQVWPQVEAGFKKAGYRKIVLYRYDYLLVMKITVPVGADLGEMGKLAEASDPRCAAWNKLMNTYQQGVQGTLPGQTWVEAKPFYQFSRP